MAKLKRHTVYKNKQFCHRFDIFKFCKLSNIICVIKQKTNYKFENVQFVFDVV